MNPQDEARSCAAILRALAEETRLAVLRELMYGPRRVGELNARLSLDQSLLSHHLKVLREAGLVVSRRQGKSVLYQLAPGVAEASEGQAINLGCCSLTFEPE